MPELELEGRQSAAEGWRLQPAAMKEVLALIAVWMDDQGPRL